MLNFTRMLSLVRAQMMNCYRSKERKFKEKGKEGRSSALLTREHSMHYQSLLARQA